MVNTLSNGQCRKEKKKRCGGGVKRKQYLADGSGSYKIILPVVFERAIRRCTSHCVKFMAGMGVDVQ